MDLSARLARLSALFVIARASAARFSLNDTPPAAIGKSLRYLIHGTAQRLDRRLRVTVHLLDTTTAQSVWTERYDRPIDDVFEVQDQITGAVVAAVEPEIERAEMERARLKSTEQLDAWECYHIALWHGFRFTATDTSEAYALLTRALEMDPRFARAFAALSFTHFSRAFLNASADVDRDIGEALALAQRSVDLDGRDAMGHWSYARALFLSREHAAALEAIDRALIANPNYAQGRYARGFIGAHAGHPGQARTDLDMSQRLSPFDPLLFAIKSSRGIALATQHRFDEAAEAALQATVEPNAHFHIHAVAAACLELAGRHEPAAAQMRHAIDLHPGYHLGIFERSFPHQPESHRLLMRNALVRAGLPVR